MRDWTRERLTRDLERLTAGMEDNFKAAFLNGDRYYFTGKPCRRGHIAPRCVSQPRNYICLQCAIEGHR